MMKHLLLLLLSLSPLHAKAQILLESRNVNPHALPGDSGSQLALPGIQLHEFNDYFGETDKLISGGGKLQFLEIHRYLSASLGLKGRFIQPILETRNDQPSLVEKIGVYAETMETNLNLAYTFYGRSRKSVGLKLTLGLAYTDAGDHGLVNVYRKIHEIIDSPINDDKFGTKLDENFRSMSYGAEFIFPIVTGINILFGTSVLNSKMFYEYSYDLTFLLVYSKNFASSLKFSYVDQKRSSWWNLRDHRRQIITGLRIFEHWTPSLMYVSPYVVGDDYGQLYLSPISFTYTW